MPPEDKDEKKKSPVGDIPEPPGKGTPQPAADPDETIIHDTDGQELPPEAAKILDSLDQSGDAPDRVRVDDRHSSVPKLTGAGPVDASDWLNLTQAAMPTEATELVLDDHYVIDGRMAQGGMGVVYRAHHAHAREIPPVVVKTLKWDISDDEKAFERFKREIDAMSKLKHPNIAKVHDAHLDTPPFYYVMEECAGSLYERHPGDEHERKRLCGEVDYREVLDILGQCAKGLSAMHKSGLVHRDIKPSNVYWDRLETGDTIYKIADLGLVKGVQRTTLTAEGQLTGTPAYMSPEQVACGELDGRTDIYSLGVSVIERIIKRKLVPGESHMQVLNAITTGNLPHGSAITSLNPKIPVPIRKVLDKMTAKKRKNRYRDCDQLIDAVNTAEQELFGTLGGSKVGKPRIGRGCRRTAIGVVVTATAVASVGIPLALYLATRDGKKPVVVDDSGKQSTTIVPPKDVSVPDVIALARQDQWSGFLVDFKKEVEAAENKEGSMNAANYGCILPPGLLQHPMNEAEITALMQRDDAPHLKALLEKDPNAAKTIHALSEAYSAGKGRDDNLPRYNPALLILAQMHARKKLWYQPRAEGVKMDQLLVTGGSEELDKHVKKHLVNLDQVLKAGKRMLTQGNGTTDVKANKIRGGKVVPDDAEILSVDNPYSFMLWKQYSNLDEKQNYVSMGTFVDAAMFMLTGLAEKPILPPKKVTPKPSGEARHEVMPIDQLTARLVHDMDRDQRERIRKQRPHGKR